MHTQDTSAQKLLDIHESVPPDYWDRAYASNLLKRYWYARRFRLIRSMWRDFEGDLLDIGCNGGLFTARIARWSPAARLTALDISRECATYSWAKHPHIRFLVADCERLPFADHRFDGVSALEVLEHLTQPELALREARRVLKPRGSFVALVPTENWLFRSLWPLWAKTYGAVWAHAHVQQFRGTSLREMLEGANFEVVDERTVHLDMLLAIKASAR